jgi:hypothetical protein
VPSINPRAALYFDCDFVGRNGIIKTPFPLWVELVFCYNIRAAITFAKFNKYIHYAAILIIIPNFSALLSIFALRLVSRVT